jgi:polysaccharide biosynthesis protein PslF
MTFDIRVLSTYGPRECGIATFTGNLLTALGNLTGEVGAMRVAAIDKDKLHYKFPVDLVIDQYNPDSWKSRTSAMLTRAVETENPTLFVFQHEFGLDPEGTGGPDKEGRGHHYVDMAEEISNTGAFKRGDFVTLTQLHTVLTNPNDYQRRTLQELAKYSDALIVTTSSAIDTLASVYDIDSSKVAHIHHGIRKRDSSEHDRLNVKKEIGLEGIMLSLTLGLKSHDKGIQFGIPSYAKVVENSFTPEQRENAVWVVAGKCHPEFVGKPYDRYQNMMKKALERSKLKWCEVSSFEEFKELDVRKYDIVFLDSFLNETNLIRMYTASNLMILPYLEQEQVSSGILADTVGSGRVAIVGKSVYSVELLYDNRITPYEKGLIGIGDPHARGFLVDPGKPSIEQMAKAIHYALSRGPERLSMERRASSHGDSMRQSYVANDLMNLAKWCRTDKQTPKGRGPVFEFDHNSLYERAVSKILAARK